MIGEMMCAFDSPGSVSKVLIIALLSREPRCEVQTGAAKTEMCRGFSGLAQP